MKRFMENPPLATALCASAILLCLLTKDTVVGGAAVGAFFLSLVVPRVRVDRIGQIMLGVVSMSAAFLLQWMVANPTAVIPSSQIGPVSAGAALGFFLVAATRLFLADAAGRDPLTCGFVFLSVLSMGSAEEGVLYPFFSLAILGFIVTGMGRRDKTRRLDGFAFASRIRKRLRPWIFATAVLVIGALIFSLPILYDAAFGLIDSAYAKSQKGFGYGMALGDLNGMSDSHEVVMRIHGRRPDYLRGAIYSRYEDGKWRAPASDSAIPLDETTPATSLKEAPSRETEIEFVGGDRTRFFLPLFAEATFLSPNRALVTKSGLVSPQENEDTDSIRFFIAKKEDTTVAPKGDEWVSVPKSISQSLRKVAQEWIGNAREPEAVLKKLSSRLKRDYVYSLSVSLKKGTDPILAFLTDAEQGNCEYFASALALLARTVGIPTRVAAGYRVHDYNPFGGYYVVEENNAHSWVEAYIEGKGWMTFDPTPSAEDSGDAAVGMSIPAALADVAADGFRRLGRFLSHLSAVQIGGAIFVLIAVWAVIRAVRSYRRRRIASLIATPGYDDPLPALIRLEEALARIGETRTPNEPIECFAERVRASSGLLGNGPSVAALLHRYADWRYGNIGDSEKITLDMDRWSGKTISIQRR